jgi:cell pole-organizing protein PopZ
MEDILASIRRILSEDETAQASVAGRIEEPEADDEADVLPLDESMLVDEPDALPTTAAATHVPPPSPPPAHSAALEPPFMTPDQDDTYPPARPEPEHAGPEHMRPRDMAAADMGTGGVDPADVKPGAPRGALVAPDAAAAAAASVGSLLRSLNVDRPQKVQVTRAGVTLEDIVRDELRPMLKGWLDENLAPLVERLVRAEIERVVGHARED